MVVVGVVVVVAVGVAVVVAVGGVVGVAGYSVAVVVGSDRLKPGTKILYLLNGRKMWKFGTIKGYPADGLVTIIRSMEEGELVENGEFTVSRDGVDLKEVRPIEAQEVENYIAPEGIR